MITDRWTRPTVRTLHRADGAILASWFDGLSDRSRELRFFAPTPRLTGTLAAQLLDVDGCRRIGLVAELRRPFGAEVLGVAHVIEVEPGRAELALAVVDAWQGRGIGRLLIEAAGRAARAVGHVELVASTLPRNTAVRSLVRSVFPDTCQHRADGTVELRIGLGTAQTLTAA